MSFIYSFHVRKVDMYLYFVCCVEAVGFYQHVLSCSCFVFFMTGEKKTAQTVRQSLWEHLTSAGCAEDFRLGSWLHGYRRLLQDDGVSEEMVKRALLMQLWATQVSQH